MRTGFCQKVRSEISYESVGIVVLDFHQRNFYKSRLTVMTREEKIKLPEHIKGQLAMREAALAAIAECKRFGLKVVSAENGQVVELDPDEALRRLNAKTSANAPSVPTK
jgi:hypothetical protein